MSLLDNLSGASSIIGAGGAVFNQVSNLASAVNTAYDGDPGGFMSAARMAISGLPAAAESVGDLVSAVGSFGGDANANDWRVRLSMAKWTAFTGSPVLTPLKDAGGLVFPYTPEINISNSATYTPISTLHTNYTMKAYQSSDPGEISINAPFNIEDEAQGLYWIAAVHYLRSLTKMFTGNDPKAGNPPPIIFLNGYGNYVFKNVPVVVTNVSINLNAETDYIGVNVVGSAAGQVQGVAGGIGGLADTVGGLLGASSDGILSTVSNIAGGVGQIAGLAGSLGLGGSVSGGVSHVPARSTIIVKLSTMYSRSSVRNFSLDRFVQGGYLNNQFGYI